MDIICHYCKNESSVRITSRVNNESHKVISHQKFIELNDFYISLSCNESGACHISLSVNESSEVIYHNRTIT